MRLLICCLFCVFAAWSSAETITVRPAEDPQMILHNPDMGWVLYENYPIDSDPHGSSTLVALPQEDFPEVDQVAIMFTWADVEKIADRYDFSHVDDAYDYWKKRGKQIQLRMSTESLLWWSTRNPPAGLGVPQYVLDQLPAVAKLPRHVEGLAYETVDARQPVYLERLSKFLQAVEKHFDAHRPVTLIDLRGFGLWGEWHSGFKYPDTEARHAALSDVLDVWSNALPDHLLALSYSYDPDSLPSFYAGSTKKFDVASAETFDQFVHYSAFDHALTLPNITFRRDGVGGAVHSNERKLLETAFAQGRTPMACEFVGGYSDSMKAGMRWVNWMVDDALSLHPNYICLLGWQGGEALRFCQQQPQLVKKGLLAMGYRLVPREMKYPSQVVSGQDFDISGVWINRGTGRTVRDFQLTFLLRSADGTTPATSSPTTAPTRTWTGGPEYPLKISVHFDHAPPGHYQLWFEMIDPLDGRSIALPIAGRDACYPLGDIEIAT